jgi:hypothetical protein
MNSIAIIQTVLRWSTIVVVAIVVLNVQLAGVLYQKIAHYQLRENFERILLQGCQESELASFVYSVENYEALERPDKGEVEISGVTYDIYDEQFREGKWYLRCVMDAGESRVKEIAKAMTELHSNSIDSYTQGAIQLFPPNTCSRIHLFAVLPSIPSFYVEMLKDLSQLKACFNPPDVSF